MTRAISNKAVAEGAVSFYLQHFVTVRVVRWTYGTRGTKPYDPTISEYLQRRASIQEDPSGQLRLPYGFFEMLCKVSSPCVVHDHYLTLQRLLQGSRITKNQVIRLGFYREYTRLEVRQNSLPKTSSTTITVYRGEEQHPGWTDTEPGNYKNHI